MLSEQTINELQQILKEEYGLELDLTETLKMARSLTKYFESLIKLNDKSPLVSGEKNGIIQTDTVSKERPFV